jgi:predicted transcriptional regulator
MREKINEMLKEDLNKLKDKRHMTLQDIADKSGVPLSTVKKIFNGNTRDPGYLSLKPILDVLQDDQSDTQTKEMTDLYERIIKHKNKWIKFLTILSVSFVAIFVALLIYDLCDLRVGFIRSRA